jgi:psp operon transcriptional activator
MSTQAPANVALIGQSPEFLALLEHVSLAAGLNRPVLLIGARGTGKEMIAERLHFLSKRWDRVFIKLNCAALPENLLESELFGYEQGAFTGASRKHLGRFELAHQGSIFLDELALMSLRLQEKLLRVLEYGEFERLGGRETIRVDVRVIGATNADLPAMAAKGEFRADLLDRLAFDVITLPPLHARRGDILPLAEHYALRMTQELQREYFAGFSADAKQQLENYQWPGNVRELKNVIERAVYRQLDVSAAIDGFNFDPFASPFKAKQPISDAVLESPAHAQEVNQSKPEEFKAIAEATDFTAAIADLERKLLHDALQSKGMNQRKAAKHLKLSYHQLRGLLRKYPLE